MFVTSGVFISSWHFLWLFFHHVCDTSYDVYIHDYSFLALLTMFIFMFVTSWHDDFYSCSKFLTFLFSCLWFCDNLTVSYLCFWLLQTFLRCLFVFLTSYIFTRLLYLYDLVTYVSDFFTLLSIPLSYLWLLDIFSDVFLMLSCL
jgi:hypothetical protein